MTKPISTEPPVRAVRPTGRDDLYHTVDGYDWVYENPAYTKFDVVRPGFFNVYREELRVGAMIECRVGAIEDGVTQVWVQVIEAPKGEFGDVMVAIGPSKRFTPCRTDGSLEEDETEEQQKENAA